METQLFQVEIAESVVTTIPVTAETEIDAVEQVIRQYRRKQLVMNRDNSVQASFSIKKGVQ